MRIGITLNEVLRDYVGQFEYVYNKFVPLSEEEELHSEHKTAELLEIENIKFKDMGQLNTFLYMDTPLEIFGHADQMHEALNAKVNEFLVDMEDEEEREIILISVEHDKSIPATNFFLSKTGMRFRNIKFVKKEIDIWDEVDMLITANPRLIDLKPSHKKLIKINHPYNNHKEVKYNYDTIMDFIDNKEILNNLENE